MRGCRPPTCDTVFSLVCQRLCLRLVDSDILCVYCLVIRSVLEYACPVWHPLVSPKLSQDIECAQEQWRFRAGGGYWLHDFLSRIDEYLSLLPIRQRIEYKLAAITFKTKESGLPGYLYDRLHDYQPSRTLRSSTACQLQRPPLTTSFADRSFAVAAPTV